MYAKLLVNACRASSQCMQSIQSMESIFAHPLTKRRLHNCSRMNANHFHSARAGADRRLQRQRLSFVAKYECSDWQLPSYHDRFGRPPNQPKQSENPPPRPASPSKHTETPRNVLRREWCHVVARVKPFNRLACA